MPLYEFRCDTCSHTFEELVRAGSAPSCPVCGNATPTRLLSTFAAHSDAGSAGERCSPGDCCGGGGCAPAVPRGGGCGCGGGGCGH